MTDPARTNVAVEPPCWRRDALAKAVVAGGASIVPAEEASALVWAEPGSADVLGSMLAPGIGWVQLPFAGIEPFVSVLDRERIWTCGKGVYSRPVAEHVLALWLAAYHALPAAARAAGWTPPVGRNLDGSHVVIVGGGGIAEELIAMLAPFEVTITVVRRRRAPVAGAHQVCTLDDLPSAVATADVVVLALALTPQTHHVVDESLLSRMRSDAVLINVARGAHVDTDALVDALRAGRIAGACLDVTDPEPLPDGHPLWGLDNCLITPHVGNTPEVGLGLLARRVEENTRRWIVGRPLRGAVDPDAGY